MFYLIVIFLLSGLCACGNLRADSSERNPIYEKMGKSWGDLNQTIKKLTPEDRIVAVYNWRKENQSALEVLNKTSNSEKQAIVGENEKTTFLSSQHSNDSVKTRIKIIDQQLQRSVITSEDRISQIALIQKSGELMEDMGKRIIKIPKSSISQMPPGFSLKSQKDEQGVFQIRLNEIHYALKAQTKNLNPEERIKIVDIRVKESRELIKKLRLQRIESIE